MQQGKRTLSYYFITVKIFSKGVANSLKLDLVDILERKKKNFVLFIIGKIKKK